MGLNRVLMGVNPSFSPLPLASAYGTMLAVSATVLALQARERSRIGDQLEVPLASAVMEGLAYNSISIDHLPLRYKSEREREIARRREACLSMDLSYEATQELLDPFCCNYRCNDGRMFYVVCSGHRHHTRRCLQVLGLYDELLAESLTEETDTYLPVREWRSDVSLGASPLPKYWADKLAGRMKAVFLTRTAAGWLDGVRVLDLCNVIAGPHSACYLARFGAEVIKIDPARPVYDCSIAVPYGIYHMCGKRSVLVDIGSSTGREVLERLVKSVDVVIWNAPDRQVELMGLDLDGLKAVNQDAIFCQLDCFGRGPRSDYVGYENHVQAATGIMLRSGGSAETPEEYAHIGTLDVMGGFAAALGVATALYRKARTDHAGGPRTSLSALSGLLQVPFCYD